jgi:hypothetical protein
MLQLPVASHCSTELPTHRTLPDAHAPVQTPLMQVWLVQGLGVPQLPVASHCSTELPAHRALPGEQIPEQVPASQT